MSGLRDSIRVTERHVLFYAPGEVREKAPVHFAAHWARALAFHERGLLLQIGTFGDPETQGSMAIFTTREGAQEFAAGDPFVLEGVVASWEIRRWNDALGGAPGDGPSADAAG